MLMDKQIIEGLTTVLVGAIALLGESVWNMYGRAGR